MKKAPSKLYLREESSRDAFLASPLEEEEEAEEEELPGSLAVAPPVGFGGCRCWGCFRLSIGMSMLTVGVGSTDRDGDLQAREESVSEFISLGYTSTLPSNNIVLLSWQSAIDFSVILLSLGLILGLQVLYFPGFNAFNKM